MRIFSVFYETKATFGIAYISITAKCPTTYQQNVLS